MAVYDKHNVMLIAWTLTSCLTQFAITQCSGNVRHDEIRRANEIQKGVECGEMCARSVRIIAFVSADVTSQLGTCNNEAAREMASLPLLWTSVIARGAEIHEILLVLFPYEARIDTAAVDPTAFGTACLVARSI